MIGRPVRTLAIACCLAVVLGAGAVGTAAAADGEPEIEIDEVTSDLEPGMSTTATIELTNVGDATAHETEVSATGGGGVIVDGGAAGGSTDVLGEVPAGKTRTVDVVVSAGESVSPGDKPFAVTAEYEDGDGDAYATSRDNLTITVMERQEFSIVSFEDTLRVGYDGELRGEIRNDGERTVENPELVLVPVNEAAGQSFLDVVHVDDPRYALPAMAPGETTEFHFTADVSGRVDPRPRSVQFTVFYGSDGDTFQQSPVMIERATIDASDGEFDVELVRPADATVERGGTETVVLEVTNLLPETLADVDAKLYPEQPLSSSNDEAFVDEIAPNETVEIRFEVSAAEDASLNTYPLELDFQYETERGQTTLSEPYYPPIEVVEPDDDGHRPIVVGGLVVASLVGCSLVVGVLWRRRGVSDGGLGDLVDRW